jgi:hypothetical protein
MAIREAPPQPAPPPAGDESRRETPYPATKARGAEIILNTPARRAIFFAGLVGAVLLAMLLTLLLLA